MNIIALACSFAILVMSVVCHEVAHGYAAFRLGDMTAYLRGRLSLNPIKHIDPFMTIILPVVLVMTTGMFFGGAKPVPINPLSFRTVSMRKGMMITAAAGPLANMLIAIALTLAMTVFMTTRFVIDGAGIAPSDSLVFLVLSFSMRMNLLLAFFNLIPIPPLDGSRILSYFLPRELSRKMDVLEHRFGIMLIFGIIMLSRVIQIDLIGLILLPIRYVGSFCETTAISIAANIAGSIFGAA